MTRCSGRGRFVAFQEHQTGAFVIAESGTAGPRVIKKFWILEDKSDPLKDVAVIEGIPSEENMKESAVCTAVSVLGEDKFFGLVMVIEGRGLYLYRHETGHIVEIERGQHESTLAVDSAFFCSAEKHEVKIRLCLNPHEEPIVLPIHHLKDKITEDNRIWQVSMQGGTVCAVSTNEVHICFSTGDPGKRNWATMQMSSVVSSAVHAGQPGGGPETCKVALLTTLGDIIVVSARRGADIAVARIRKNSRIEPFVSSHTRDSIFAWDPTGTRLFLCKSGGALQTVEPAIYAAAVTIQNTWRSHTAAKKKKLNSHKF